MSSGLDLIRSYLHESNDDRFSEPLLELFPFFYSLKDKFPDLIEKLIGSVIVLGYSDAKFAEKVVEDKQTISSLLSLVKELNFRVLDEPVKEFLNFLETIELLKI